jgi:hypothetical protein
MMVINRRPRIIGAAQAGPERGGDGIDVVAHEARPRAKILVEPPDPLKDLLAECHVGARHSSGRNESVRIEADVIGDFKYGHPHIAGIEQKNSPPDE